MIACDRVSLCGARPTVVGLLMQDPIVLAYTRSILDAGRLDCLISFSRGRAPVLARLTAKPVGIGYHLIEKAGILKTKP